MRTTSGLRRRNRAEGLFRVVDITDRVETMLLEQRTQAVAKQHVVIDEENAYPSRRPVTVRCPGIRATLVHDGRPFLPASDLTALTADLGQLRVTFVAPDSGFEL
jgi:hypothetical protein